MNRDEFFETVKIGDRFIIRDAHGRPEAQIYTATDEAQHTDDHDLRVTFAYPIEQTRQPGAIRWSRFSNDESFEIVEA